MGWSDAFSGRNRQEADNRVNLFALIPLALAIPAAATPGERE